VTSRYSLVRVWEVLSGLPQCNLPTLALSAVVAGAILLGNRFAPRWPLSLFAVAATIAASKAFDWSGQGIAVIGPISGGLPSLKFPAVTWSEVLSLLPVSASCFVMIIAQSAATSRVYATIFKERVDEDADILGIAAANAAAAVSGAFVVNGSPTQTAMADQAGARSQVAQLAFAAVVLVVLLFLTGPLQYLPHCVLASIVFTIAVGMVNVQGLSDIRRESPGEFLLALFTAAAVPAIGVEQGILLAIALSLVQHVRHSYQPHTMVLAPGVTGRWEPAPATPGSQTEPGLIIYRFGADLFYANADRFADEVRSLVDKAPASVRWFVLDAGTVTDLDYSAARTVRDLLGELTAKNVGVMFARVNTYHQAGRGARHAVASAARIRSRQGYGAR
jgi:sulfate permease, SulP family